MNGSGSKRPKNSPVDCQMGYTGETVPIPSSRWLMSVVGSLGSSLECPGAMRRLSRCEVCFLLRGVVRGVSLLCPAGCVASMECSPTRHVIAGAMSPCPVVGVFLWYRLYLQWFQ